jgi:2-polyprenyl-3-methyl-5-hydroxy-6-metoxy-1,4-benzoquinol methylase
MTTPVADVETRARQSLGTSADPIYRAVADTLVNRHPGGGTLIDVGCGTGNLWSFVRNLFDRYVGADVLRYGGFPDEAEFHRIDLDSGRVPLPDGTGDVVAAVETIEHLENPRAFARELARLCRPGGWVVVTTPNQLSLLSKLTLLLKNEFNAFRAGSYPAHLTALLEIDLRRIAAECGLADAAVRYTRSGRVPGTATKYPQWLSRLFPRALSDNVLIAARKPGDAKTS